MKMKKITARKTKNAIITKRRQDKHEIKRII